MIGQHAVFAVRHLYNANFSVHENTIPIDFRRVHELPQSKFDFDLRGGRFTRFKCEGTLRAEYPDFVYERDIFETGVTFDIILFLQVCTYAF